MKDYSYEHFKSKCIAEEGGAGDEGTDKLRDKYIKDTPYMKIVMGELEDFIDGLKREEKNSTNKTKLAEESD
jgi:hypothetical protein